MRFDGEHTKSDVPRMHNSRLYYSTRVPCTWLKNLQEMEAESRN